MTSSSKWRRLAAPALAAVVLAASSTALTPASTAVESAQEPFYTLLSHPDFLNADIGDLSAGAPGWREGDPNSTNSSYTASLDLVLDEFRAQDPDSVVVAGDLVGGHWGRDPDGTGYFGPVGTDEEKRAALRSAADLYYTQWLERFTSRDLEVHVAVGDHDIGDNPWAGSEEADFKRSAVGDFKEAWAQVFTRPPERAYTSRPPTGPHTDTAYATMLSDEILLVTVDTFSVTSTNVAKGVFGAQLRWLDGVLAQANADGVDWIVVQGHLPALWPVRARYSSKLRITGGADSPFWRTLAKHKVDLYLTGEVHDTTAVRRDGVTQISHGGMFYQGQSSFLLADFFADRLQLAVHDFSAEAPDHTKKLWSLSRWGQRPPETMTYHPGTKVVGTMELTKDNRLVSRTGRLDTYQLPIRMEGTTNARTLTNRSVWSARSERGAAYEFQTERATGSRSFGARLTSAPQPERTFGQAVDDGQTTCSRARASASDRQTSAWSRWRCVVAPYDDRVLERRAGRLARERGRAYYHRTTTLLRDPDTVVVGPRAHRAADLVRVGVRVGPRAGKVAVSIGGEQVATLRLRRDKGRLAWLTVKPGGLEGRVSLRKVGAGAVRIDGIEIAHLH
jgi:3',5'-cyclic AMP phosphodiesterase CpdA